MALTWAFAVERVRRIELPLSAWEADVLPLNYTRSAPTPPDGPGRALQTRRHRDGDGSEYYPIPPAHPVPTAPREGRTSRTGHHSVSCQRAALRP